MNCQIIPFPLLRNTRNTEISPGVDPTHTATLLHFTPRAKKSHPFLGVTLCLDAPNSFAIRLIHTDPQWTITLCRCYNRGQAQAEWRRWARSLQLPLLVEHAAGVYEPYSPQQQKAWGKMILQSIGA